MPQEIAVFTQRLPKNSMVTDNKEVIMEKMRVILGLEHGDNLVDPAKTLPFSVLEVYYLRYRKIIGTKIRKINLIRASLAF